MCFAVIGVFSFLQLGDGESGGAADGVAATTVLRGDGENMREMTVRGAHGGHFLVKASINNEVRIRFMIDTGATMVALSAHDARRLKLDMERLKFTQRFQTANGVVRGAPVKLREIRIGDLVVKNVRATVMSGNIGVSLLGNSFLRRLRGYEVRGDLLVMRW
jgi:aspartyl protease family protein